MHFNLLTLALIAPAVTLAAPALLSERQARPAKPTPCVRAPNATEAETKARSEAFAQAFIYEPNISEAFKYISEDYIASAAIS